MDEISALHGHPLGWCQAGLTAGSINNSPFHGIEDLCTLPPQQQYQCQSTAAQKTPSQDAASKRSK